MGRIVLYGFMLFLIAMPFGAASAFFWLLIQLGLPGLTEVMNSALNITFTLLIISFLSLVVDLGILLLVFPKKRQLRIDSINPLQISVGMTAYNDEGVIGKAVKDFLNAPNVIKVTVIDNNCVDRTAEEAREAGARVVKEPVQGYGAACIRALKEARKFGNLVVLVEGDQTFSASDLKKLIAYIENTDMVVGTRTTMEIVAPDSQVNWFICYGNIFIAKLLQLRFWGTRFTDVGCTYRAIRPEALDRIIDKLQVIGNHFSPHMIIEAMKADLKVIEVPLTLYKRAGVSKGVGSSVIKGLKNGVQMAIILFF